MVDSDENGYCPTCDRVETIFINYDVTTHLTGEGREDTWTTISAACRRGHDIPDYLGQRG